MDMTAAIEPKSDQINADDLITGPRTFTIKEVVPGSSEQPVNVHLVENPGKPYRPSKSMARVMVAAWGKQASAYAGHRITLFRDPEVTFGKDKVGGIKISHITGIERPLAVPLTVKRGSRKPYVVQPLIEQAPTPPASTVTPEMVAASVSVAELQAWWQTADPSLRELIEARAAEVKAVAE